MDKTIKAVEVIGRRDTLKKDMETLRTEHKAAADYTNRVAQNILRTQGAIRALDELIGVGNEEKRLEDSDAEAQ